LPSRVRAGEAVPISLRVRNGDTATDLYLRGRDPTFDVVITDSQREVIWRRLENEIIPAIVNVRILAPNEEFELVTTWDQRNSDGVPVHAGEYSARALLLVEGEALETLAQRFLVVQ
jgi:hypothetical protein